MNLSKKDFLSMANAIRMLSVDAIEKAKSGHPGMPMGMADIVTVLFSKHLKFNPEDSLWPDRDRFIISNGHGSMLLYSLFNLTGYEEVNIEDIKNFRQLNSKTAGHPEHELIDAIETTTGPLGQGFANAVGMAIAEKNLANKFGEELVNHYTYVTVGDGCLMEGISLEAASIAGHLGLNKLIVFFDDNNISIDGSTNLTISDNHLSRFASQGWNTLAINGHDFDQIDNAIKTAKQSNKPTIISCKTIIGYGSPNKQGNASCHGAPLGGQEIEEVRKNLNWDYPPFEIPDTIKNNWVKVGQKCQEQYKQWQQINKPQEFVRLMSNELPINLDDELNILKKSLSDNPKSEATRNSSHTVLNTLTKILPELIGGSADLTGSNNTKTDVQKTISKNNYSGNYIYYGIREHAMAAIMNGMSLHKGIIPYGGTFLVFSDYCRPAIRLSALMKQRVIYVMTHDSIGLGEDGPTHQPVEHLASLRAIPNLNVFRPADSIETLECWQLAISNVTTPSILSLTRQKVPQLRTSYVNENLSSKGAYIIAESDKNLDVTIFATGSEVKIALDAKSKLEMNNIGTRVVSVPCVELFFNQDKEYIMNLTCNNSIKVAVEAALSFGWERLIGNHGLFIGMKNFGASAPAEDLYKYFNITDEEIVKRVMNKIEDKKKNDC